MGAPPDTERDTTEGLGGVLAAVGIGIAVIVIGLPLLGAVLGLVAFIGATVIGTALWAAPILIGLAVVVAVIRFFLDA
jgi:hypothetical protein